MSRNYYGRDRHRINELLGANKRGGGEVSAIERIKSTKNTQIPQTFL